MLYFRSRFLRDAMLRERVTEDEILSGVRGQGIYDFDQVQVAVLETDGSLSASSRAS